MVAQRLSPEEGLARVEGGVGDMVSNLRLNFGQVDLVCERSKLLEVMTKLRDDDQIGCRFFTFLSGVDRSLFDGANEGDETGALEVLIHVYSPDSVLHVNVHVPIDPANPACPSMTGLFGGANWHERETWEMFGIVFEGHPSLAPLYLPEDFEGHPLLKSFKLPSRMVKEWPGAKDPEEAAAGGR